MFLRSTLVIKETIGTKLLPYSSALSCLNQKQKQWVQLHAYCSKSSNDENHPIKRTLSLISNDLKKAFGNLIPERITSNEATEKKSGIIASDIKKDNDDLELTLKKYIREEEFQTHCDVLVIGGGSIGASTAFWLKKKARDGLNVIVVEKDSTYQKCSTTLSVGGLRQQFSLPENIQMSLYGADFIRNCKEYLGDDIELNFTPNGYLVLSSEKGAETLQENSKLQNDLGARNEILTPDNLKQRFQWLNTDGIALGCHGLEKEGWFDPWALLMGFKKKACEYGAHFVEGEIVDFEFGGNKDIVVEGDSQVYKGLDKVIVQLPNGEKRSIKFALCVLAGGAQSGKIAKLANIGIGKGMLSISLPVEPRKRYVYVMNCQGGNAPGLNTPLTVDPTFTYFRRDGLGGNYICGKSPDPKAEPPTTDLEVDYDFFNTDVWPHLANRVPAFESIKVTSAWAGYYEVNTFDSNGIIGAHPFYHNLYIATGFSGHGIQQAPAVGRAISELIIDGGFRTIDLSRFSFDRIIVQQPMFERNCV